MSRSGYDDDYGSDDPLALGRYRAQVMSAIRGKRGQALLRELLAALDAMPNKHLVAGELEADGSFCALGVVGAARGMNLAAIDTYDVESLGPKFNIAEQLAREIMWVNDEHVRDEKWVWVEVFGPLQPWQPRQEQIRVADESAGLKRWCVVRKWVAAHVGAAAHESGRQSADQACGDVQDQADDSDPLHELVATIDLDAQTEPASNHQNTNAPGDKDHERDV